MMKLRHLLYLLADPRFYAATILALLLLGAMLTAHTQAVDPPPPSWVPIASEGTYQGTSPIVTLPAGTIYTFGLTTKGGVICDAMTAPGGPITVWVASFSATCKVNEVATADPDPNIAKTLYVESGPVAQSGTYTVPPSTTPIPWSVPANGGAVPPIIPPVVPPTTTPVVYTCSQSVTLTFGGVPVTITNTFSAISLSGSPVTSQTAGISCVIQGGQ